MKRSIRLHKLTYAIVGIFAGGIASSVAWYFATSGQQVSPKVSSLSGQAFVVLKSGETQAAAGIKVFLLPEAPEHVAVLQVFAAFFSTGRLCKDFGFQPSTKEVSKVTEWAKLAIGTEKSEEILQSARQLTISSNWSELLVADDSDPNVTWEKIYQQLCHSFSFDQMDITILDKNNKDPLFGFLATTKAERVLAKDKGQWWDLVAETSCHYSAITDKDGRFAIPNIRSGKYYVTCQRRASSGQIVWLLPIELSTGMTEILLRNDNAVEIATSPQPR